MKSEVVLTKSTGSVYSGVAPFSPSRRTWLSITAFALFYLFLYMKQPKPIRYIVAILPLFVSSLFLIREIKIWILGLLVLITFGGVGFEYGPFYTSAATIGILITAGIYFLHRNSGFKRVYDMPTPFLIVVVAYLVQLGSVFASIYTHDGDLSNTLRDGNKYFVSALLLPVVYYWYGRGIWLSRFLKVLTSMLFVMSIVGIYQYTSGNIESLGELACGFDLAGRVYSTISGGPNAYAGVLELLVPSTLAAMFFFKEKFWKGFAFVTVILGILNVLYTFSRGGFLTVSGTSLLFLVYRFRSRMWIPVTSLAVFVGFIVGNAGEFERQLTMFGDTRALMMDTSLLHRYTSYKGFLNEIAKDPIGGEGWGCAEFFHGRTSLYGFWEVRHEDSIDKINRFGGLNSMFLEMPLKGGILSAVSLLLLLTAVSVSARKLLTTGVDSAVGFGFMCGMLGFGVHQMFDNLIPWPQPGAFFWIVFALMTAMAYPCCSNGEDSV